MKLIIVFFLNIYQNFISPLLGNKCRFYPSCSEYAKEIILNENFFKALVYIFLRLLKCNQFFKGGINHVPYKKEK